MSENKQTVHEYMDAFGKGDRPRILACLTDDVQWEIPGMFRIKGREAFEGHIRDEGFTGDPEIRVSRLTEEDGVVIAEGTVRTQKTDGSVIDLAFCDVFEMRDHKIARLVSYLVMAQ